MKIIGLAYKKGVGKDTLANFLMTHLRCTQPGLKVKKISFAAKLKDVTYQLYSWAGLQRGIYYESHREEKEIILPKIGKSARQIWIAAGNKFREIYSDTWIDYALNGIKADIIIITDVRFINEAVSIQNTDGLLVKINRDGLIKGTDPAEVELDSWSAYTDWDYEIDNNGTLKDLNAAGVRLLEDLI